MYKILKDEQITKVVGGTSKPTSSLLQFAESIAKALGLGSLIKSLANLFKGH